jgi:hypothetical protein
VCACVCLCLCVCVWCVSVAASVLRCFRARCHVPALCRRRACAVCEAGAVHISCAADTTFSARLLFCVCVCLCACACVRVCVCECVRGCARVCVGAHASPGSSYGAQAMALSDELFGIYPLLVYPCKITAGGAGAGGGDRGGGGGMVPVNPRDCDANGVAMYMNLGIYGVPEVRVCLRACARFSRVFLFPCSVNSTVRACVRACARARACDAREEGQTVSRADTWAPLVRWHTHTDAIMHMHTHAHARTHTSTNAHTHLQFHARTHTRARVHARKHTRPTRTPTHTHTPTTRPYAMLRQGAAPRRLRGVLPDGRVRAPARSLAARRARVPAHLLR